MSDDWRSQLEQGRSDAAWDLFLARYRRLLFAAIRHYAQDYDDVMDVFAHVCEQLREHDLRRLRAYVDEPAHKARFSTWLVTVVRHLTIDWFRQRDGRARLPAIAERLPALRRRIFEHVFLNARSHVETYELLCEERDQALSFRDFLIELRATYRAVTHNRRGRLPFELAVGSPLPLDDDDDAATDLGDVRHWAERALDALSAEDRVAVQLYVMEEMPAEQVATTLGLANAKAVYNKVYRALALARERLEQAGLRREDLW